jgi:hypothetical protein
MTRYPIDDRLRIALVHRLQILVLRDGVSDADAIAAAQVMVQIDRLNLEAERALPESARELPLPHFRRPRILS